MTETPEATPSLRGRCWIGLQASICELRAWPTAHPVLALQWVAIGPPIPRHCVEVPKQGDLFQREAGPASAEWAGLGKDGAGVRVGLPGQQLAGERRGGGASGAP